MYACLFGTPTSRITLGKMPNLMLNIGVTLAFIFQIPFSPLSVLSFKSSPSHCFTNHLHFAISQLACGVVNLYFQ